MGEAELNPARSVLTVCSHFHIYGGAADAELTELIRRETEELWNEPQAAVIISGRLYHVQFRITASLRKDLSEMEVLQNTDPKNNYFRIEEFVFGNISFVDGLGCNSGYFKKENLYAGSTTAAHEYGHTLGLPHPRQVDIRGRGVPGIMYPRGTLVDSIYQYDPAQMAGLQGGTMHPMHRRVRQSDVDQLRLDRLEFYSGKAIVGDFTNVYHWNHAEMDPQDFMPPPIAG